MLAMQDKFSKADLADFVLRPRQASENECNGELDMSEMARDCPTAYSSMSESGIQVFFFVLGGSRMPLSGPLPPPSRYHKRR